MKPHLKIFGFPVRFEPFFFVLVAFIAFQGQNDLVFTAAWIVIITASVLIHELGHAFAYRHYGATPSIALHGMGGVTFGHNSRHLTARQRIVVSAAGSITTMVLLGGPAWLALRSLDLQGDAWSIVRAIFFVNVVWAAINLAPVFPLDGGQIVDDALLILTGKSQRRIVNWISLVIALAIAAYFYFVQRSIFAMAIFGYMAYVNINQLGLVGGGDTPKQQRQPRPSVDDVLAPRSETRPAATPPAAGPAEFQPPTSPPVKPPEAPPS